MFKKDEPAAEKRGGDFEIRSETRFDNFYDLNLLICTSCRSRSRSKVPEGKRRNIRRLILQFLQFFRPGKVEPFQIWTRPTPYMSMLTKKETFHFVGLLDFQYLLLLWPSLEDALVMCNKTSFIAEKRTVLCNKHFHCVFIAENQHLKKGFCGKNLFAT